MNLAKPKFLHVTSHKLQALLDAPKLVSGLYQWHKVMDGPMELLDDCIGKLHEYDVIYLALSQLDVGCRIASRVRQQLDKMEASTKFVISVDYAVEMWGTSFQPYWLKAELLAGDLVMVSTSTQQSYTRTLLDDQREVHVIPHPTDLDQLQAYRQPLEARAAHVLAMVHMYDNNWLTVWLIAHDCGWPVTAIVMDQKHITRVRGHFAHFKAGMPYVEWLEWMPKQSIMVDSYQRMHSYGRQSIECAALGIPMVGSNLVESQPHLWPDLTADGEDVWTQRKILKRLMKEPEFYKDAAAQAAENVGRYGHDESRKRFTEAIWNTGKDRSYGAESGKAAEIPISAG